MRIPTILLLIILAMTACGSPQPVIPIIQPPSMPSQPATPVPVDTASTGVPADGTLGVSSGTVVTPCTCPDGTVTSAQPQGAASGTPTVICNCPVNIVPPPLPGPINGSTTPQAVPTNGVSMADNRKTFSLHPGESFLLNLGDTFSWRVSIDNQNVLAMEKGILVVQGAQGIYQANNPGQAILTAIGKAVCQPNTMCMALAVLFKITVIVQ